MLHFMPHRSWLLCVCAALLVALLAAWPRPALAGPVTGSATAPVPAQILVKVKATLAKELEAALLPGSREIPGHQLPALATQTLSPHGQAQRVVPLYPQLIHLRRRTGWTDAQMAEQSRQAFPGRARRLRRTQEPPEISRTYLLDLGTAAPATLQARLADLRRDPNVEYAELNRIMKAISLPNDPFLSSSGTWGQSYQDLWGHYAVQAPAAWATSTGEGIVVAVIDTGVDASHPDLAGALWTNPKEIAGNGLDDDGNGYIDDSHGWDFVGDDFTNPTPSNNPVDHHGHGTHVAGTIAARGNNGLGIIGIAYQAKIMALRGLDQRGMGLDAGLAQAIHYAATNGADVINASWGRQGTSQTYEEAVRYASSLGVIFVAGAGNDGIDAWGFTPANVPEAITVAAAPPSPDTNSLWASDYGTKIDVAAPGWDVLSLRATGTTLGDLVADNYTRLAGTSMATPHVTGVVALLLAQHPQWGLEDVRQLLRGTANSAGPGDYPKHGPGLVNAQGALALTSVLQAHFLSPAGQTEVTSALPLTGTAQGPGFDHYSLEVGAGLSPSSWRTFATSATPVVKGPLGTFDPGLLALPDGTYVLRLTAVDAGGRRFQTALR